MKHLISRPAVRAALVLIVLSAAAMLWWRLADADWIDAWMPNIVTAFVTVAVTITVVEEIIRRTDRDRARPRRECAEQRLVADVHSFASLMYSTYRFTHVGHAAEIGPSIRENVQRFLEALDTETSDPLVIDGKDDLIRYLDLLDETLIAIRNGSSDVLDHDLLQAIDDYRSGIDLARTTYQASLRKRTLEGQTEVRKMAYQFVGEAFLSFSEVLVKHQPTALTIDPQRVERYRQIDREVDEELRRIDGRGEPRE